MNEIEEQLHNIEVSVEQAKEVVALAEALQRLHHNADFKKVILTNYFEKESLRSVMLKSDPNYQSPEQQKDVMEVIGGIGMLGRYFHKIFTLGEQAHNALVADEQTREELLAEQLADDTDLVN